VPFPRTVKGALYVRHGPPSTRYCSDWTPLVTSELVKVTLTEERYEPSFARVPDTWAELTGPTVSIWKVDVRAVSLFPARSVA